MKASLEVANGDGAFERDSVVMQTPEIHWPLAAALSIAHRSHPPRVVDFGGSLGSLYFQHRGLLKLMGVKQWVVVEQPHFVDAGQEHLRDGVLEFSSDFTETLESVQPDMLIFSSVLQYLEAYEGILRLAMQSRVPVILIDRTFLTRDSHGTIWLQIVPKSIYSAQYPCWLIPIDRLADMVTEAGYQLVAQYENMMFPALNRRGGFYGGLLAVSQDFQFSA